VANRLKRVDSPTSRNSLLFSFIVDVRISRDGKEDNELPLHPGNDYPEQIIALD
jgi:hypothetical protein